MRLLAKMRGRGLFLSVYNMREILSHFSMDSDLEAFSYYLADNSVTALLG